MRLLPADRRRKWIVAAVIVALGLPALALLLVAAFPIGLLKPIVEKKLSARFGRPVTIASLGREDVISLHPTVSLRGVRVPQPAWVPGGGDLARVGSATLRLSATALLRGIVAPEAITLDDAHFALVRGRDGRENWHRDDQSDAPSRRTPVIEQLTIARSTLSYRDAKRDRAFAMRLSADPARGLVARGSGEVRGSRVTIAFRGGPVGKRSDLAWPVMAQIDGADLAMTARGAMASPLDTNRMALDVTARASDLRHVDAIIEAGLFATQPVRLSAHVERTAPDWRVTRLEGQVGRSRLAGAVTVTKGARTRIDGTIRAALLDFDDLSSDEGLARAAAKERAIGPRLVPDTRIDLSRIGRTDGVLRVRVDRIVSRTGSSAMRTLRATATMDRQRLEIADLRIGLTRGAIAGRVVADQRGGAALPTATFDLRLSGSSIEAVAGGGGSVTGRLDGRALLTGRGATIRAAVGAADGRIGIAARDGALPERIADALGFDAGRALFASDDDRARLRCVIVAVAVRGGQGRVAPLIVDTSQSQLRGAGGLSFPSEALAIRLTGAPKRDAVLRLPGSATLGGTLMLPDVQVPREVKSAGNVLRAIGRAIGGAIGVRKDAPVASDADCAGLSARVLR